MSYYHTHINLYLWVLVKARAAAYLKVMSLILSLQVMENSLPCETCLSSWFSVLCSCVISSTVTVWAHQKSFAKVPWRVKCKWSVRNALFSILTYFLYGISGKKRGRDNGKDKNICPDTLSMQGHLSKEVVHQKWLEANELMSRVTCFWWDKMTDLQSQVSLTSHWNYISEVRGFVDVVNLLFLCAHSAVAPCWCQGRWIYFFYQRRKTEWTLSAVMGNDVVTSISRTNKWQKPWQKVSFCWSWQP